MYGISMDIGTSGIRAHAVDMNDGKIISTAITEHHPLPGGNVMDHLTFCINLGVDLAHEIMMATVNRLIGVLGIDLRKVSKVSICGNPIQLSIFQNMEIRDLAFAGDNALKARDVVMQNRNACILSAQEVGLNVPASADLLVPPAIKHEIGADALAMLHKSGFLDNKANCMVTDYGTNAEMALKVDGEIFTGSAAAGPAMEGQHIKFGRLASPGAISDLDYEFHWRCKVLDKDLMPRDGNLIDFGTGALIEEGEMNGKAMGITGTGVIAVVSAALGMKLFRRPKIHTDDGLLRLQDGISLDAHDIQEACKAFGAMRAGHFSLIEHAGINFQDLDHMYMSGASGTYVDALKARDVGLLPPSCRNIDQIGNTSLAMATDIIRNEGLLDDLQAVADGIRSNHVMFATDPVFEAIYMQELAYWGEGMSMERYNNNLRVHDIQSLPAFYRNPSVNRLVERDIPVLGRMGLTIMNDVGVELKGSFSGCTGCGRCQEVCPGGALTVRSKEDIVVNTSLCLGTACHRCQMQCPEKVFHYAEMVL